MSNDPYPHGEASVIVNSETMVTRDMISIGLRSLGLCKGDTVLVHVSLSNFGWVCGGAQSIIMSLQDVLTGTGTLVMPAHTSHLSEPSYWTSPPVPEEWWQGIREEMPAFDRDRTPTWGMGCVAEAFRSFPGVQRSCHPQVSFAAWGRNAQAITGTHQLALGLGDGSPLARVYERDGRVLLLGVSHKFNTSLHLAEHRADWPTKKTYMQGAPIYTQGRRTWVEFEELAFRMSDFENVGAAFDEVGDTRNANIGSAECRLMSQRALVDFASRWFSATRQ